MSDRERVSEDRLEAIRRNVSIVGVVGRHVKLRKAGPDLVGLCPFHKEKSPSFNVVPSKAFAHCFGCGAHGDVIGMTMRLEGLTFLEAVEYLEGGPRPEKARALPPPPAAEPPPVSDTDEKRLRRAERIWDGVKPIAGTETEHYLRIVRGCQIDWPATVQHHPSLEYWHSPDDAPKNAPPVSLGRFPAVVAMRETVDGDFAGVWVIWLAEGGQGKADVPIKKQGFGHAPGSAVRLGPPAEEMVIGEGLEDTAAAIAITGGVMPGWAALSTSGIRGLALPEIVRRPIVYANNDPPKRLSNGGFTRPGLDAARAACERWKAEGRNPGIQMPVLPDWCNVLEARMGRLLIGGAAE